MDTALRHVTRELRYRDVPDLIGTEIQLTSLDSVPSELQSSLRLLLPHPLDFRSPELPQTKISLAKYGILDVTFAVQDVAWDARDEVDQSLLSALGFVQSDETDESEPDPFESDGPTSLETLQADIQPEQVFLRLFLNEQPPRDLKEYFTQLVSNGKASLLRRSGGAEALDPLLEGFFPKLFMITDACYTNAERVWFHKHFYL